MVLKRYYPDFDVLLGQISGYDYRGGDGRNNLFHAKRDHLPTRNSGGNTANHTVEILNKPVNAPHRVLRESLLAYTQGNVTNKKTRGIYKIKDYIRKKI